MNSELHSELLLAAVSYADRWQWPVTPGVGCAHQGGRPSENVPGPASAAGGQSDYCAPRPTTDALKVAESWTRFPHACIRTPVGYNFDAVSVPEAAGKEAVSRIASVGLQAWSAFVVGGRVVFLLARGLGDELRMRVGPYQDGQGIWIYSTHDLLTLPPSHGTAWLHHAGPLVSFSAELQGLLPALVSATARHTIPLRTVAGRLPTHPTARQPSRASRSAGPATDPSYRRRSRHPPLIAGDIPHRAQPYVGSRHLGGLALLGAASRGTEDADLLKHAAFLPA